MEKQYGGGEKPPLSNFNEAQKRLSATGTDPVWYWQDRDPERRLSSRDVWNG